MAVSLEQIVWFAKEYDVPVNITRHTGDDVLRLWILIDKDLKDPTSRSRHIQSFSGYPLLKCAMLLGALGCKVNIVDPI